MIWANLWGFSFLYGKLTSAKKRETFWLFFSTWLKLPQQLLHCACCYINYIVCCTCSCWAVSVFVCVQTLSSNRGIRNMWWRWRCCLMESERWGKPLLSTWSLMKTWWLKLRSGARSHHHTAIAQNPDMKFQLNEKVKRGQTFFFPSDLTHIYIFRSVTMRSRISFTRVSWPRHSSTFL